MGSRVTSYEGEVDNFEATELRLGLPGRTIDVLSSSSSSSSSLPAVTRGSKRTLADVVNEECISKSCSSNIEEICENTYFLPPEEKVQVVGWPPIRTFRKNIIQPKRSIKVSMDGVPYLRKMDLNVYKGYKEFDRALVTMFSCFSLNGKKDSTPRSSEYLVVYEDKDGDWMLVGDVPWEMFISSCKRLRISKGSEAKHKSPVKGTKI